MENFTITKEQILELKNTLPKERVDYLLKEYFPKVFGTKLEVGKWYKCTSKGFDKFLFYLSNIEEKTNRSVECGRGYGFCSAGDWFGNSSAFGLSDLEPATTGEVEAALIAEAKKRGFKEGVYCSFGTRGREGVLSSESFEYYSKENVLSVGFNAVFQLGKWAEIIPTITKQEAEEKLKCKIV